MRKNIFYKSFNILSLIIAISVSTPFPSAAFHPVEGINGGPGVFYNTSGEIVPINSKNIEIEQDSAEGETAETNEIFYIVDGIKYKKETYIGTKKLTGYSGEKWGTDTASGAIAKEKYTVSASSFFPFGTVLIIDSGTGPTISNYNGAYVVQDRGGTKIESGEIIDLFFNTQKNAKAVTDLGWNYAHVWIGVPVE